MLLTQAAHRYISSFRAPNQQYGATLIVVLVVLLLLSVLAVISIRHSQTALNLTTASQVQQLLMQSSDLPLAKLQMAAMDTTLSNHTQPSSHTQPSNLTPLEKMASEDSGPIRFLELEGIQRGAEFIFCYQPTERQELYKTNEHRILLSGNGNTTLGNASGYCHIATNNPKYFTSARKAVATQLSLSRITANQMTQDGAELMPFQTSAEGIDESSVKGEGSMRLRATVTSVLPIMANKSTLKEIDDCLKLATGALAGNLVTNNQILCLNAEDAPTNIQVQDYAYLNEYK